MLGDYLQNNGPRIPITVFKTQKQWLKHADWMVRNLVLGVLKHNDMDDKHHQILSSDTNPLGVQTTRVVFGNLTTAVVIHPAEVDIGWMYRGPDMRMRVDRLELVHVVGRIRICLDLDGVAHAPIADLYRENAIWPDSLDPWSDALCGPPTPWDIPERNYWNLRYLSHQLGPEIQRVDSQTLRDMWRVVLNHGEKADNLIKGVVGTRLLPETDTNAAQPQKAVDPIQSYGGN